MLTPSKFFLWSKPRLLIDIRPSGAYNKGSLEKAQSFPIISESDMCHFIKRFSSNNKTFPLHLIDVDGKSAEYLSTKIDADYLEGGYKFFKKWRNKAFESGPPIRVLCGFTGSGKTEILKRLADDGQQVIDLEKLAAHNGSVFGQVHNIPQPLHEHFQIKLLSFWLSLNPEKPVWIEEKGPFLGKNGLPEYLYKNMQNATKVVLDVPFDARLKSVMKSYGDMDQSQFRSAIKSLENRMGMSQNHKTLHYFDSGQTSKCFELLLQYYDNAYRKRRELYWTGKTIEIQSANYDTDLLVQKLTSI